MKWFLLVTATVGGSSVAFAQASDSAAAAAVGVYPASPPDTTVRVAPSEPAQPAAVDTAAAAAVGIYLPPPVDTAATTVADTALGRADADTTIVPDSIQPGDLPPPADTAADQEPPGGTSSDTSASSPDSVSEDTTSLTARMDARRGGGLSRREFPDLRSSAAMVGEYRTFLDLADRSPLGRRLTGDSLVTVIAPTDSAFAGLAAGELARLRDYPALRETWLGTVLLEGSLASGDLVRAGQLSTRGGSVIRFSRGSDSSVRAGPARLVAPDLVARNGTLHGADRVVLPETISASP